MDIRIALTSTAPSHEARDWFLLLKSKMAPHKEKKLLISGVLQVVAGSHSKRGYKEDVNLLESSFNGPEFLAIHPESGDIFISDTFNHCIRKYSPKRHKLSLVAGTPEQFGYKDGAALTSKFNTPRGIAFNSKANLFIADERNGCVRKITFSNNTVTTFIKPHLKHAQFGVTGLAIDKHDNLYVSDHGDCIYKITRDMQITVVVASPEYSGSATLRMPMMLLWDIVVVNSTNSGKADVEDVLIVSDILLGAIHKIDIKQQHVKLLYKEKSDIAGMRLEGSNLYFTQVRGNSIKCIDLDTLQVKSIAGTECRNADVCNGAAMHCKVLAPYAVAVDVRRDKMYIADSHSLVVIT